MDINLLRTLADSQHGVITRQQARETGITDRVWYRLQSTGVLRPVHKGVAVLVGHVETRRQRMMAAVLSIGDHAIVSHRSAGEIWGVWNASDDDPIDVIVGKRRGRPVIPGVIAHVPRDLDELAPLRRDDVRVTGPARTLLDIAGVNPLAAPHVVERMLMAGLITRRRIAAVVARHSKQGRAGIGPVREILVSWPYEEQASESVLEYHLQGILGNTPLPPYETQIEVGPYRLDAGWSRWKVGVEADGWGKFGNRDDFERLSRRDNFLQSQGWLIAHFSWRDIVRRPGYVYGAIHGLMTSRGWAPERLINGVSGAGSSPMR
ncbi:MAG: hypothetical protein RIS41_689 [Actinomycetota bacterium]